MSAVPDLTKSFSLQLLKNRDQWITLPLLLIHSFHCYYYYYRKKRFRWRNVKRLQGHITKAKDSNK